MKLLNDFKKGIIQGVGILTILGLAGITYAAFNFNDTISEVSSNGTLSSAEFNKLVKKLNMIDENQLATAWVNFDGTDCPGNICTINDSFNVDHVTKVSTGLFDIYFEVDMSNLNYSTFGSSGRQTNYSPIVGFPKANRTLSKVQVLTHDYNGSVVDTEMYVQIFGGK